MRYSRVNRRLWGDRRFRALSAPPPNARDLWLYLLTCPTTSPIPGVLPLRVSTIAEDLGWASTHVLGLWHELEGMAVLDAESGLVWLPKAVRHDPPQGPNHVKGWARFWPELPESSLLGEVRSGVASELRQLSEGLSELFLSLVPSSSEPLPEASEEALPDPSPIPTPTPTPTPTPNKIVESGGDEPDPWGLAPPQAPSRARETADRADRETRGNRTEDVRRVFEHWQQVRRHPTAKLDGKRRGKIQARLREGFTAEQLCQAIDGVAKSAWHCGDNPGGKVYDDLVTVLRDAPQVENFLALGAGRPKPGPRPEPPPPPPVQTPQRRRPGAPSLPFRPPAEAPAPVRTRSELLAGLAALEADPEEP